MDGTMNIEDTKELIGFIGYRKQGRDENSYLFEHEPLGKEENTAGETEENKGRLREERKRKKGKKTRDLLEEALTSDK